MHVSDGGAQNQVWTPISSLISLTYHMALQDPLNCPNLNFSLIIPFTALSIKKIPPLLLRLEDCTFGYIPRSTPRLRRAFYDAIPPVVDPVSASAADVAAGEICAWGLNDNLSGLLASATFSCRP